MRLPHYVVHCALLLGKRTTRKKLVHKPKILYSKVTRQEPYPSEQNALNCRNASIQTSVPRYWIFAPALSTSYSWRFMLNLWINNKNSSYSQLLNKAILNSYVSDFSDTGSLCNLILTDFPPIFHPSYLVISGIWGGSTRTFNAFLFHCFLF